MKKFADILSSFRLMVILLAMLVVSLASATWIEKVWGTQMARDVVYHSPVFFMLLLLIVVNFFMCASRHRLLTGKRFGLVMTHSAFVVIIAGAAVTHFFGEEGVMYIREGECTGHMMVSDKKGLTEKAELPFQVYLEDFVLKRYPGSESPSSYESFVRIYDRDREYDAHIYMNNVFDVRGYRLYQTSYDLDEKGTILSVSHDRVGRTITYIGYFLLFVGLILSLVSPNGRFRRLYRSLVVVLLLCPASVYAYPAENMQLVERFKVNETHAEMFGTLPVQSTSGRMMPVNTFSSEILRKLYKQDRIGALNSDQFILSVMMIPEVWIDLPCISVKNEEVASLYHLETPHSSYVEFFDADGRYKLQGSLDSIYRKNPAERTRVEKEVLKLDERVNIFHLLAERKLIELFPLPDDPDMAWYAPGDDLSAFVGKDSMFVSRIFDWYVDELFVATESKDWSKADEVLDMIGTYQKSKATGVDISERKMHLEVLYNKLDIFRRCRVVYLFAGIVLLLLNILSMSGRYRVRNLCNVLAIFVAISFAFHTAGMGMRWWIGGYAPWTNSYETMVYVAWATVLAGILFLRRNMLVYSLAVLFGGIILFVSGMNWMDPHITTLVPVLKSPWLMFHVAVIVAAYGFLGLSSMMGGMNLLFMAVINRSAHPEKMFQRIREISVLNELSMWIGLVLLTIGTFLGAVWANESWGRYWGWDPKETWALITIIVYVLVTHIHLLRVRLPEWLFNFMSVVAFFSVLMTFLGVNYLLSGMHSYGQNDQMSNIFIWIFAALAIILLLGVISLRTMNLFHKRKRS